MLAQLYGFAFAKKGGVAFIGWDPNWQNTACNSPFLETTDSPLFGHLARTGSIGSFTEASILYASS